MEILLERRVARWSQTNGSYAWRFEDRSSAVPGSNSYGGFFFSSSLNVFRRGRGLFINAFSLNNSTFTRTGWKDFLQKSKQLPSATQGGEDHFSREVLIFNSFFPLTFHV